MRPKRKNALCALAMLAIVSMLLLMSCATQPATLPVSLALDWPVFPSPEGQIERVPEGSVIVGPDGVQALLPPDAVVMPLDYLSAIAAYVVDVQAIQKFLAGLRGPVLLGEGD